MTNGQGRWLVPQLGFLGPQLPRCLSSDAAILVFFRSNPDRIPDSIPHLGFSSTWADPSPSHESLSSRPPEPPESEIAVTPRISAQSSQQPISAQSNHIGPVQPIGLVRPSPVNNPFRPSLPTSAQSSPSAQSSQ
ncbi:hypothetical protein CRG98_031500 [Punica granatum]|uniref:Uncharacterized protein n=1 Tax=Punica granatum TaxID=22663 RepID=A0A2I0IVU9_PUNGR|nr:hypothetical protein CRG98_031500 [Punica granatum]